MHDTGMDFLEAYKALTLEHIRLDGLRVPSMAWKHFHPGQVGKKSVAYEAQTPCSLAGSISTERKHIWHIKWNSQCGSYGVQFWLPPNNESVCKYTAQGTIPLAEGRVALQFLGNNFTFSVVMLNQLVAALLALNKFTQLMLKNINFHSQNWCPGVLGWQCLTK